LALIVLGIPLGRPRFREAQTMNIHPILQVTRLLFSQFDTLRRQEPEVCHRHHQVLIKQAASLVPIRDS
jgi:hypothetical protein